MPVVVFHRSTVHIHSAVSGIDEFRSVNHSVVECHHQRCRLEHRTRLQQVAHGVILSLAESSVGVSCHVHNRLYVARWHIHDYRHAHLSVYFFQFFYHGTFGNILHLHVNGSNDVCAVDGLFLHQTDEATLHFLLLHLSRLTAQHRVERQFQSESCRVFRSVQVAHGS